MSLRASIDLKLGLTESFEAMADELAAALASLGMEFKPGVHSSIRADGCQVARVVRWQPPEEIELVWEKADWQESPPTPIFCDSSA